MFKLIYTIRMADINKKDLEHLAELSRIELKESEEAKLLKDLEEILNYFKELQELDTENVEPMTGGTDNKNVVREDMPGKTDDTGKAYPARGPGQFPENKGGYLKVPPVF